MTLVSFPAIFRLLDPRHHLDTLRKQLLEEELAEASDLSAESKETVRFLQYYRALWEQLTA